MNEEKRWLKFSVIARSFKRNGSATSFLDEDSSSFLKDLLLLSSIFRKSSREKLETLVESSFEMEVVVLVVVEWMSLVVLEVFPFLLPMVGNVLGLSTS